MATKGFIDWEEAFFRQAQIYCSSVIPVALARWGDLQNLGDSGLAQERITGFNRRRYRPGCCAGHSLAAEPR